MVADAKTGLGTMGRGMENARNYHGYIFSRISPFLGKRIFEIGSGFGQYTEKMGDMGKIVLPSDIDLKFIESLKRFDVKNVGRPLIYDFSSPSKDNDEAVTDFQPDTVVCMNVLEHIEDDVACLARLHKKLPNDCRLILIVPAFTALYNVLDVEAGHYRRYSLASITGVLEESGWLVETANYINLPGIPGWLAAGILNKKRKGISLHSKETSTLIRIFDCFFVPVARLCDMIFGRVLGLSILTVAVKKYRMVT